MILRPDAVRLVAAGKKTQARRPLVEHQAGDRPGARTITIDGVRYLYPFAPMDTVAVQPGRGKPAATRVLITRAEVERLGDITFQAAVAEGCRTTREFMALWVRAYDPGWVAGSEYPEHNEFLTEDALVDRFDRCHADRMVWAVTFEVDRTHHPRLLAPAGRPRGDELGYTNSPAHAMRGNADAGEAVDPAVLEFYAQDALERFTGDPGRRHEMLKRRAGVLAKRLRNLAASAANDGRDVLAQLDQIERHINQLDHAQEAEAA